MRYHLSSQIGARRATEVNNRGTSVVYVLSEYPHHCLRTAPSSVVFNWNRVLGIPPLSRVCQLGTLKNQAIKLTAGPTTGIAHVSDRTGHLQTLAKTRE